MGDGSKDRGRFSVFGAERYRLWFRSYSKDREPSPVFGPLPLSLSYFIITNDIPLLL